MDTSIEARFEGHEIIESGTAQIPNLLIWHYAALGLKDGHFALISHVLSYKWTREAPYPTVRGIRMSTIEDTRRRYVRELRNIGLLFTRRLYWTNADMDKHPEANPGRVRANEWYLGSLLHNLVRVKQWIAFGNPLEEFCIEIPAKTVQMFLEGYFHDVPKDVAEAIQKGTDDGKNIQPVLLCENNIVDWSTIGNSHSRPTVRKASTRKASTRKTHSHEEESDSNKNQLEKEEMIVSDSSDFETIFGQPQEQQLADYDLPDGHQEHVDHSLGAKVADPIEEVAKHLGWGIMNRGWELPTGKKYRNPWLDAGKKLLALTDHEDWRGVCWAINKWFESPPKNDEWTWKNADKPHKPVDCIARYYNRAKTRQQSLIPEPVPQGEIELKPVDPVDSLWQETQRVLAGMMTFDTYTLLFARSTLEKTNGHYTLLAPNDWIKEIIEHRQLNQLQRALTQAEGEPVEVEIKSYQDERIE